MKLKKIASLALAGIMAVSMLAGCKDGTSQEDPSSSSQVPTTSNAAEYANYMLSDLEKSIFAFTSSSTLNEALNASAGNVDKLNDDNVEEIYDNASFLFAQGNTQLQSAYDELTKKLNGKTIVPNFTSAAPTVSGDRIAVKLYGVSGKVTEEEAVKSAVKDFVTVVANVNNTYYPAHSGNFDCEYTAEISTLKVASRQHPSESAWTVAIVVTQTASVAA